MTRIWVLDTCAILQVRRHVCPGETDKAAHAERKRVYAAMDELARAGRLVFPRETYNELKIGNSKVKDPTSDLPLNFVEGCKAFAERKVDFELVKELGGHPLVHRVTDPESEDEEADVYVLALALKLQRDGLSVGVLSQETKDLPARKISVSTACGVLGLVCLRVEAFLDAERIYAWK